MARPNPASPRRIPAAVRVGAALVAALAASAVLLVGAEGPVQAASPLTLRTVTIDGGFSDWDAVLANPLQTTRDGDGSSAAIKANCALHSTDRDCPQTGGAGNDFLTFAWTYDASFVYLYLERYGSTANGVDFLFVADVDRDQRLTAAADVVVHARWFGSTGTVDVNLGEYSPADAANGDPIACAPVAPATDCANAAGILAAPEGYVDGYKLPGTNVSMTPCALADCEGLGAADGTRAEIKVPWSAFGVTVDQPFYWHTTSSNNGTLASVVDNIGAPNGKLGSFTQRGVSLAADRSGAVASPGQVTYAHTLQNDGNDADLFDLVATSSHGAQIELVEAGVVLATDLTGDGTWDSILPGRDQDADGRPDVSLLSGAARDLSLRISMPSGRSGADATRLTAVSAGDPLVSAVVTDTSQIGTAAFLSAAQAGTTVAAQALPFRETLRNAQAVADTFRLAADAGCSGFQLELAEDAAGNPGAVAALDATGDGSWDTVAPAADTDGDGAPDLGPSPAGETRTFHLLVTPPTGTAAGTACTVALTATSTGTGASAAVRHDVAVAERVTFAPDYRGTHPGVRDPADAQVATGSSIFLPATIVNAESSARTYDLSVSLAGPAGGSARVWSDPDGDGSPSDGAVVATTGTLAPWGGTEHLVIEVRAGTAPAGSLLVATTTARAVAGGAEATQISEVAVGYVAAYADALHADAASAYAPCATVYVGARGLLSGDATRYALAWVPPSGTAPAGVSPWATTAVGTADAELALPADAALGAWTARLLESGATKDEVGFAVELAGTIPSLATDRDRYQPGDAVTVTAEARNGGGAALLDSTLLYSGAISRTRSGVDVLPGERVADAFTFALAADAAPGAHDVTLGWQLSCGSSPFATQTVSFAVAPPPPAITAPAGGARVGDATPTVEGTALAGASVVVVITDALGARTSPPVPVDGDGRFAWTVPDADALSEGVHAVTATQLVGAVASDASAPVSFELDTTPPLPPAITSPASGSATSAAALAVSGSAADPEAVSVSVLADGGAAATVPVVDGAFDATVTLADGTWALTARALDGAGNASPASAPVSVTVDRSPPAAPTYSVPSPTALAPVPISGAAEAGATVQILDGTTVVATATADGGGAFSAGISLAEGTHALWVRVLDRAGNATVAGPTDVEVDRTAPPAPSLGAPEDAAILGLADLVAGRVPLSGTAESGAVVEVEIDGLPAGTAVADGAGSWSVAVTAAGGAHVVRARATDRAGNASDLGTASGFTLDADLPEAPVLGSPDAAVTTNLTSLAVSGTAEPGATVQLLLDGAVVAAVAADGLGAFDADVTLPARDGTTVLTAVAVDAGGNGSAASAGVTVAVDRTAPAAPTIEAPADGAVLPPGTAEVRGRAEVGARVAVTAAGTTATAAATADGAWSVSVTLPEGTHPVTATATDGAGNASPATGVTLVARTDDGAGGGGGCGCRTGSGGGGTALLGFLALLALAPRGRRGRAA